MRSSANSPDAAGPAASAPVQARGRQAARTRVGTSSYVLAEAPLVRPPESLTELPTRRSSSSWHHLCGLTDLSAGGGWPGLSAAHLQRCTAARHPGSWLACMQERVAHMLRRPQRHARATWVSCCRSTWSQLAASPHGATPVVHSLWPLAAGPKPNNVAVLSPKRATHQ